MVKCPKCQHVNADSSMNCSNCGINIEWAMENIGTGKQGKEMQDSHELDRRAQKIICTTAPSLEGYHVTKTLEVITAECVFGMNIFRDAFANLRDFFGGRSKASQKVLRDARKTCLWELKKEAAEIGADAVIAVDLDYSEFSGAGSMLFLVASGTAVKVEPISIEPKNTDIMKA